jgi:rhamnosyl/mannosyltransferase
VHILHIYKDYPPVIGGIEHHLRDLAEGLAARGHQITVLVTSPDRHASVEDPLPNLRIVRAARDLHVASTPLSIDMLRRVRNIRADLVHLHFPYPPGDIATLLAAGSPPLVVTYHSDIVRQQTLLRLYRPLLELTLRRARRLLVSSPAYIHSSPWLRRYAATCTVVPLGVDPARFASADRQQVAALRAKFGNRTTALFVGRLRYYKGLHILLDALPHALEVQLIVAGSGPEQNQLMAQVQALGLADRVYFLGDVADAELSTLHHACDLFVLPAHLRAEAFGIAQAEALASGLPCISTELGTGTSFVNQHGHTGIVVPPNDPVALARALNTLAASPALRQFYATNARQRITAHFTHTQMLDQIEQVYRAVAEE